MLQDGEEMWQGRAYDIEHAEDRCFYHDSPGSLERYTLQRWGKVKVSREISVDGWVTVYENQSLVG